MKINELARTISQKGNDFIQNKGVLGFHLYATELLASSQFHKLFDLQEIAQAAFSESKQNYAHLDFSDLPITLAEHEHCFIDVYFWRRRATTIHNHHFSGAFMCLTGNNIDLEFTFAPEKPLGKFHELGKITLHQERNIKPGDIATIAPLNRFIHQNHHQAELTVNLCFRTRDREKHNLSSYLFSGLRYEKDATLLARVARLRRLIDIGNIQVDKLNLNSDDAINFLIQSHGMKTQNPLLTQTIAYLEKQIMDQHGVSVDQLMQSHNLEFDRLENEYE